MEQTLVIAGLSAVVSVASVVANLYLARKSRESSLELEKLKAELKKTESTTSVIKELEVEGERLRIRCWELVGVASSLKELPRHTRQSITANRKFSEASKHFTQQAEAFLDRWASAKTELPDGIVEMLRSQRHRCRRQIAVIAVACETLAHAIPSEGNQIEQLDDALNSLLSCVDRFILTVSTVRRAVASGDLSHWTTALETSHREPSNSGEIDGGI